MNLKRVAWHCFTAEPTVDLFQDSVVNLTFVCLLPGFQDEIAEHSVLEA